MAKILLVDDDADMLEIAAKTLSNANHQAHTALDALSALDILNGETFDALITDANMPHHSGYELVQTLRNDSHFDKMAVALLTGRRNRQDIEKALKLGVDDYIIKPFDPLLFLTKVELLLQQKRGQDPSQGSPEVHLKDTSICTEAKVELEARLETLSEVNITLTTDYKMESGQILNLKTSLFDELGIAPPAFKVLSSIKKEQHWLTTLLFVGTNDFILQKIRAHIYKSSGSRVA